MTNNEDLLDEAQVIEEEVDEEEEEIIQEQPKPQPKKDSVVKLLEQRNAHKARADQLEAKVKELEPLANEVNEIKEMLAKQAVELENKKTRDDYYSSNPTAKELATDIEKLVSEKNLSYDEAFKLAAAENKPELLLEVAVMNKTSGGSKMTGIAREASLKEPSSVADYNKMSDADFLAWSQAQAKAERVGQGKIR